MSLSSIPSEHSSDTLRWRVRFFGKPGVDYRRRSPSEQLVVYTQIDTSLHRLVDRKQATQRKIVLRLPVYERRKLVVQRLWKKNRIGIRRGG